MSKADDQKYVTSIDHDEDPMYDWEVQFGSCEHTNGYGLFFLMIISIIKILLFIWGLYLALTVIKVPRKILNDSFEIVVAVILASALFICVTPLQLFIPTTSLFVVNFRYASMVFAILIAANIGIGSLVLPRFVAIYRGEESKYAASDDKKLNDFKQKCRAEIKARYDKMYGVGVEEEGDDIDLLSKKSIRSQSSEKDIIELTENAGSSKSKNGYSSVNQEE